MGLISLNEIWHRTAFMTCLYVKSAILSRLSCADEHHRTWARAAGSLGWWQTLHV